MPDEASTVALGLEVANPDVRSTILCALMDACDRAQDSLVARTSGRSPES